MPTSPRICPICKGPVTGRHGKKFCSIACKNSYHVQLRRATATAVRETDKILHRNRSILLEVMGKNKGQKKIDRKVLDKKKFNYQHITGYSVNSRGKTYHTCMTFPGWNFLT